ncbi:MAG: radical SAM protein, partial [Bdellovibrionota bacterium]
PRIFDFFVFLTFDDGEEPLVRLLTENPKRMRTWWRNGSTGAIVKSTTDEGEGISNPTTVYPDYRGYATGRSEHLSLLDTLNPMHRIWSDGRWLKLMLAHGCYWKKCAFCDTHLDYIGRFAPSKASVIADQMEAMSRESGGLRGFHFVDEAAPPALLSALADELLKRGMTGFSWWGNVRFDRAFTPTVCAKLAKAGCIALTGGLEVASDRLLKLMNKGVTFEQVARVTHAMSEAGIRVHCYLMYGFPTQTVAETVDSLERVRQLFAEGCIQSAFWHRFSATAHSGIGRAPHQLGIEIMEPDLPRGLRFARNDLPFRDPTPLENGIDHDLLGIGLNRALYNYMQGVGLDLDVRQWFDVPGGRRGLGRRGLGKTRVPKNLVRTAMKIR